MKEAWPVTTGDLAEVGQGRCEPTSGGLIPGQCAESAAETALHSASSELRLVGKDLGNPMDPTVGDTHIGP